MKYYLKIIYPLLVIAVFFGLVLSIAFWFLGPKIDDAQKAEEENALMSVFPEAVTFITVTNNDKIYYEGYNNENELIGYIFKEGEVGYGGPVLTLIGINLEGTVETIFILNADQETPGLGYKCMERGWQNQFSGLSTTTVPRDKAGFDSAGLDAITGATITSMAVADNISLAFELYDEVYQPVSSTNGGTNVTE